MKLKHLEPGDSVKVKEVVDVNGNDAIFYIDGKLIRQSGSTDDPFWPDSCYWLVEYQLEPVMGAPKYQNWWYEDNITSKHYVSKTDEDYFEKAEKISIKDYSGVLFYNDRYFYSADELLEWCNDNHYPKFVWACDTNPVKLQLDLESYVSERLNEDGYEDMSERPQFSHLFNKLQFIQDNFVEMASKEIVFYPNYKKAVIL